MTLNSKLCKGYWSKPAHMLTSTLMLYHLYLLIIRCLHSNNPSDMRTITETPGGFLRLKCDFDSDPKGPQS